MKEHAADGVALAGTLVMASGIWLMSPPWALIVVGLALIVVGLLMAKRER